MNNAARTFSDLRGCGRMAIDATNGVTGLVEAMYLAVARASDPVGVAAPVARLVCHGVRGATRLVGSGMDAALAAVIPFLGEASSSAGREAAVAILNGVLGDYLAATANPLAITMRFRRDGCPLELETRALADSITEPRSKVLVLVHGLCLNDLQWARGGEDGARALAADLGYTPVHLHYNSGLHVSTNGRRFSELLETLIEQWPVPVEELAIVAHSMGGLISRSAHDHGTRACRQWPRRLRTLVFLGTPHHGASWERVGNWVDRALDASAFTMPLGRIGKLRSAGITDLRFGSTRDSDWIGHDRFENRGDRRRPLPLPDGVQCYAIGAIVGETADGIRGRLLGDGLVPIGSALGLHADPRFALGFPESHQWTAQGMNHLDLLNRPDVYERVRIWLSEADEPWRQPLP